MQQGDYSSAPYYHYPHLPPNPNPAAAADPPPMSFASAPPFSSGYSPSDYPAYPPYGAPAPAPDPIAPPTAPSYAPPPISNSNPQAPPPPPPPVSSFVPSTPQAPSSFPPFDSHAPYQPPPPQPPPQQSYYAPPPAPPPAPAPAPPPPGPYDQLQAAASYPPQTSIAPPALNPSSVPNQSTNSTYSSIYASSAPYNPPYEPTYDNSVKYDQGGSFLDDRYGGGYGRSMSDYGSDFYRKQSDVSQYGSGSRREDAYGDGVFAYEGGKVEPYGARGTSSKSSTWSAFDDYGRPISFPSGKESSVSSPKIVRAVPKAETQQDVKSGVQKFRVKLLPESGSQSTMDVLCQIGLDGIRMLDPSTSRTLRIYPLETITRCEVTDSSIFSFWSKSSVDIEPRRIRLQSNRYTTNTLLDTVTAATVQLKEMGGRTRPSDPVKTSEQPAERKKGIADWMNLMKPGNEEKDHWVPDEAVSKCTACGSDFSAFIRRHHCRNCGDIFCDKCTHGRIALTAEENAQPVRVCDRCLAEVTQRLSNAKEASSKPVGFQSHEDLARKLQEEMERNRKGSAGSQSDGSGRRMKEVACPICTVHLQVQVPTSGSETIECGVCQHPFLVSAH